MVSPPLTGWPSSVLCLPAAGSRFSGHHVQHRTPLRRIDVRPLSFVDYDARPSPSLSPRSWRERRALRPHGQRPRAWLAAVAATGHTVEVRRYKPSGLPVGRSTGRVFRRFTGLHRACALAPVRMELRPGLATGDRRGRRASPPSMVYTGPSVYGQTRGSPPAFSLAGPFACVAGYRTRPGREHHPLSSCARSAAP